MFPYDHTDSRPIVFVQEASVTDYWNFRVRTNEVIQCLMRTNNINRINPIGTTTMVTGTFHAVELRYNNALGSASVFLAGNVEDTDSGGTDATLDTTNAKIYIGTSPISQNGPMRGLVSDISIYTSGTID
jgi:hypothetical protein